MAAARHDVFSRGLGFWSDSAPQQQQPAGASRWLLWQAGAALLAGGGALPGRAALQLELLRHTLMHTY